MNNEWFLFNEYFEILVLKMVVIETLEDRIKKLEKKIQQFEKKLSVFGDSQ